MRNPELFEVNDRRLAITRAMTSVAVGHFEESDDLGDAAVWISDEVSTGTRIRDEGLLGGPGDQGIAADVAFTGGLVAVGLGDEGTIPRPGVWLARLPDG